MRILLAVVAILAVGLGVWWIGQRQPATVVEKPPAEMAQANEAATEAAADAAADAAAIAADVAAEAAQASQDASVAPASDAAAEAEAAAEAALEAADRAAEAAAAALDGKTEAAARDAASAAQDAAAATTQAASAAIAATQIQALLTPEGFDAGKVGRIIDTAAISDQQKATLRRLIETAGNDPDLLRQALDQVRAVMP